MALDLTKEAAEGFAWHRRPEQTGRSSVTVEDACPYLNTSPAAMAWHVGRHLAAGGMNPPQAGRDGIRVLTSRGNTFKVILYSRGRPVNETTTLYRWNGDNSVTELP